MKKSTFLILASTLFLLTFPVHAATSTDSADVDPETIKENIKKRIEQVIKNQEDESKDRLAYLGTVNSFTTNSFSLDTAAGDTQQASTSALTVVVDLPKNKEITMADISIGDYVAALGYLYDNTKVLDTRRILVLKNKPELPTKKSVLGLINDLDLRQNTITLKNLISNQETEYKLSSKAIIQIANHMFVKSTIPLKEIPLQAIGLVIYEPSEVTAGISIATSLLIKSPEDFPSPVASTSASPTP